MFGSSMKFPNFAPKPSANEAPFKAGPSQQSTLSMPMQMARLARMRSFGFGSTKNTMPMSQPMALTMGSHGSIK